MTDTAIHKHAYLFMRHQFRHYSKSYDILIEPIDDDYCRYVYAYKPERDNPIIYSDGVYKERTNNQLEGESLVYDHEILPYLQNINAILKAKIDAAYELQSESKPISEI